MKISLMVAATAFVAFTAGAAFEKALADNAAPVVHQQPAPKSMLYRRMVKWGSSGHRQCVAFCPTPQERAGERQQRAWDSQGSHGGNRDTDSARYMQRWSKI
jgi:hypothetical protein